MAESRAGRIAGWVALGVGAATTAAVVAQRVAVTRERSRPDPFAGERYGDVRGKPIGPVASFDGTLLHAEETGRGPAVVLSHGFSLNLTIWHHQMLDLSPHARLVLYDHRGHGRSSMAASGDWSLEALARDLDAVVTEASGGEPVVLVGHSMGGMTVLKYCELFADRLRERVAGIVLVDTTSADVVRGVLPVGRRIRAILQVLQEGSWRLLAGKTHRVDALRARGSDLSYLGTRIMGFGSRPSARQVDFVEEMLSAVPSEVWVQLIPAMMSLDVTHVLPEIDVPAVVMVGTRDRLTPPGAAKRIAEAIPSARLVEFYDAGHTPMLEVPNQFNARILEFVAGLARARR
ncbi:MAG TPA: alpha/beta hydrolase [Actinomycetota bacterium]